MAGKNKVETGFRLQWDSSGGTARDLSGDLIPGSVSGGGIMYDEANLTGVSNTIRGYLSGHGASEVSARFFMNDTATTGATTVLNATHGSAGTLTLQWGASGAAPTTGDPEWEGEYVLIQNNVVLEGNVFAHDCRWVPQAGQTPAWGTVA